MGSCLLCLYCADGQGSGTAGEGGGSEIAVVGDYSLIPLPRLLGTADLAVIGVVAAADDVGFTLRVSEPLVGRHAATEIQVKKYVPPALFGRQAVPYVGGQRFALFLEQPREEDAEERWTILGYAGEGQMWIEGGFVYLAPYDLKGLEYWPVAVEGVAWKSQRLPLDEFQDAVSSYHRCFSWERVEIVKNEKRRQRWVVSRTCGDETLETYRARSWLHGYLVRESVRGSRSQEE